MKKYFIFTCLILLCAFHQNSFSKDKPGKFDFPVVSIKAGYHTGDNSGIDHFPHGFSIDGTLEVPTGKSWFVGFNYDLSYAYSYEKEWYLSYPVSKNYTNYSFTPFVKYRFVIKNWAIYLAAGIGGSKMVVRSDNGTDKDGMVSSNIRIGADYLVANSIILSGEGVYHTM